MPKEYFYSIPLIIYVLVQCFKKKKGQLVSRNNFAIFQRWMEICLTLVEPSTVLFTRS
jgi:hypothetical protein